MKTIRNLAFLLLVAVAVITGQGVGLAMDPPPTIYDCPDGCTCEVDIHNYNHLTGSCDVGSSMGCAYGLQVCDSYCSDSIPDWYALYYNNQGGPLYCWILDPDGFTCPETLEPPTEFSCDCFCWQ
jgi:hypothetical protein